MHSWHGSREKRRFPIKKSTGLTMMQRMWTNAHSLIQELEMAEEQVNEQLTDEEIKNAVQEKRAGEQDREVNGGVDNNYVEKDPRPTRGEVLQASTILRCYVRESGNTFAWQMETILGRFSRQTRLEQVNYLVETSITDFFLFCDCVVLGTHTTLKPIAPGRDRQLWVIMTSTVHTYFAIAGRQLQDYGHNTTVQHVNGIRGSTRQMLVACCSPEGEGHKTIRLKPLFSPSAIPERDNLDRVQSMSGADATFIKRAPR
ncbi:hypothetical protein DFH08DRAFT_1022031 [Mycena albidolilacea]|uniref:Uncharacterized protein n=1 Tax=Mycena albidolilacea TaxID=1033008 RepID=A0AAD6ZN51_9AGAR|nr:hypothetical protein DFH08DRAFT_1022031 [Mycena albidolilacea]